MLKSPTLANLILQKKKKKKTKLKIPFRGNSGLFCGFDLNLSN